MHRSLSRTDRGDELDKTWSWLAVGAVVWPTLSGTPTLALAEAEPPSAPALAPALVPTLALVPVELVLALTLASAEPTLALAPLGPALTPALTPDAPVLAPTLAPTPVDPVLTPALTPVDPTPTPALTPPEPALTPTPTPPTPTPTLAAEETPSEKGALALVKIRSKRDFEFMRNMGVSPDRRKRLSSNLKRYLKIIVPRNPPAVKSWEKTEMDLPFARLLQGRDAPRRSYAHISLEFN